VHGLALYGDAPADAPLFVAARHGGPISERYALEIVKGAARDAGLTDKISPHWLRHAHISHALDNGAPVSLVSQSVGHADMKTTSIYAHARPGDSSGLYLKDL
jgi:integrase/recombinase XerD